jgi:hypothetical protein
MLKISVTIDNLTAIARALQNTSMERQKNKQQGNTKVTAFYTHETFILY